MLKTSNEITVKIKCQKDEFYKILEEKGFKIIRKFKLDDIYYIPKNIEIGMMSTREILSKAIIIRKVEEKETRKLLTFKQKEFDKFGNIISQSSVDCRIETVEEGSKFLEAIGYKRIMQIIENDIVYGKNDFQIAVKDIENGNKLIEIETIENNDELDTIEKIKNKLKELKLPIYEDNYFVKKAEIELDKVINNL